jgi:predicted TIM-barrel fold metal-dependent hydrolase
MTLSERRTANAELLHDRQRDLLANAERETEARGLREFPIVDVDCHILETVKFRELAPYIDHPAIKRVFEKYAVPGMVLPGSVGDRDVAGRIFRGPEHLLTSGHADLPLFMRELDAMGIDYASIFPTPMLSLGLHPDVEMEVALARAYNTWVVEEWLQRDARLKAMLYLPFNDPEASLAEIERMADKPGVIGFMVTSVRKVPLYHNRYMPVYATLEERGLPLGFHTAVQWRDGPLEQLNRFLSVHALGFPLHNMVQMTNIVVNGLPERFPRLRWIFFEAGVYFIPFVAARLDNSYMMRASEAPILTKKPSEYIRDFYFSTQPIEWPEKLDHLEAVFDMIGGETQLLYASDWPHWDFDLPSQIYDLPFLSEEGKRRILGRNAMELFNLPDLPQHAPSQAPAAAGASA